MINKGHFCNSVGSWNGPKLEGRRLPIGWKIFLSLRMSRFRKIESLILRCIGFIMGRGIRVRRGGNRALTNANTGNWRIPKVHKSQSRRLGWIETRGLGLRYKVQISRYPRPCASPMIILEVKVRLWSVHWFTILRRQTIVTSISHTREPTTSTIRTRTARWPNGHQLKIIESSLKIVKLIMSQLRWYMTVDCRKIRSLRAGLGRIRASMMSGISK